MKVLPFLVLNHPFKSVAKPVYYCRSDHCSNNTGVHHRPFAFLGADRGGLWTSRGHHNELKPPKTQFPSHQRWLMVPAGFLIFLGCRAAIDFSNALVHRIVFTLTIPKGVELWPWLGDWFLDSL